MKTIATLTAVALGTLAMAGSAHAQDADAQAGALIVAPLQIENQRALYFGTIAPSVDSADTVVISPAGAKNCGDELTCLSNDHTAAAFAVSGDPLRSYTIELPDSIQIASGDNEMTVDNFSRTASAGQLNASGEENFNVGGQLNVGANQASGEYTGSFTVSVNYQ